MIEHVLTDADTLQGLSALYGVSWKEIADYNGLEYPYTLTSSESLESLYANGYLTITRDRYTNALTVDAGSIFFTEKDAQGIMKRYQVTTDTVIPAGVQVGYVHVRSTNYGTFGNTIAHSIGLTVDDVQGLTHVTNEQAFTNGTDARVRTTGQIIYIPKEAHIKQSPALLADLAGEDVALTEDGDLMDDGFGDVGTVTGIDNIAQSIRHRLRTRRGDLPHHPEYGSRLQELIGKTYLPYMNKLIEIDIHETLSEDDRLGEIVIHSVQVEGTSVSIRLQVQVANVQIEVALKEERSETG